MIISETEFEEADIYDETKETARDDFSPVSTSVM